MSTLPHLHQPLTSLTPNSSSPAPAPHLKPYLIFTPILPHLNQLLTPNPSSPSPAPHPKPFLTSTSPSPQAFPHLYQPLTQNPSSPSPPSPHSSSAAPRLHTPSSLQTPSQPKLPPPPLPAPGSPPAPGTCSVRRRGEAAAPGRAGGE